jgi:hypothetical protein
MKWLVQGTGALSKAGDYPRSKPAVFANLTANTGPNNTLHVYNHTTWCYKDEDIAWLYHSAAVQAGSRSGDSRSLPAWAPWVISAGVYRTLSVAMSLLCRR